MGHIFVNKILLVLLMTFSIIGSFYISFKLLIIWIPFLMAWWISNLLSPVVEKIVKKFKIHISLVTFFILILFIAILLLLISALGYVAINEAKDLMAKFPEITEAIQDGSFKVTTHLDQFKDLLPKFLTDNVNIDIPKLLENINLSITTILASIIGIAAFLPNFLIGVIVMFVAAFFMTKDKMKLKELEMEIWSKKIFKHPLVQIIKNDVLMVLLGYIKAQLILMTLTFIEISIGLTILKIPNAILIGLGIGFLDALPVFGTGSVFIPWIIVLLFYQNYGLAIGILVVYLIATLGRQSLEPKIISTQIGIHPLITLTIIYTGIKLFGIWGIIIAPLTAITFLAIKKSEILKFQ
ncbi:MAG: sporulation integral membrane protein YtvI [Clostridia bacterium]|nr:sporulation integral membrane protein YtvI [Clostridia bacterium]